jgi:hypothetical protein
MTTFSRPDARVQVAILTGQSNPDSCVLSPLQARFLADVATAGASGWSVVDRNFPYGDPGEPHRDVPLLPASVANARQYLVSRERAFAERHRASVLALLARAPVTVFLAGSCGLELFANLHLPEAARTRCRILAYGPVARRAPDVRLDVVVGKHDWISRGLFHVPPGVPRHTLPCGHRDYLAAPGMRELAVAFIRREVGGFHAD